MKQTLIITHPGSAHFDDITAISLILAVHKETQFKVERRLPLAVELEDPAIWVVDTGNVYEPAKLDFDHHQSLDCSASFVLVARYLGLLETLSVLPWWNFKDSEDRIGFTASSQIFNAGDQLVNQNPVETWLTDQFVAKPQASLAWLKSYGNTLIKYARSLKKQIEFWENAERLDIAGVPVLIGETQESMGLEEFRRLASDPPDIIISLDRRSPGWRLFRYEGTPVDFRRIADLPEIEFAHRSGFLAKTRKRLPLQKLIELVSRAVIRD